MNNDKELNLPFQQILIIGEDKLSCSLSVCLSGHKGVVTWYTLQVQDGLDRLRLHHCDMVANTWPDSAVISVTDQWPNIGSFHLIWISNQIPLGEIKRLIRKLEEVGQDELIIAVGTAGIPLAEFQAETSKPENIVGINWTEPVHTTYFMEIVANEITKPAIPNQLLNAGKNNWNKDPYLINGEVGIQDRMMSALLREALFLIKNDYSSPLDIDRACRNDAGTYLPFIGNFRYMDLMGTYLYGLVMEELNKELSTDNSVVEILHKMVSDGHTGVEAGQGFYTYDKEDARNVDQKMRTFSFDIRELMDKYVKSTSS